MAAPQHSHDCQARAEGAGFTTLMRNLGSSVGIAVGNALLTRNTQVNHAAKLLLIATLAAIPLLLVFKKPSGGGAPAHSSAAE